MHTSLNKSECIIPYSVFGQSIHMKANRNLAFITSDIYTHLNLQQKGFYIFVFLARTFWFWLLSRLKWRKNVVLVGWTIALGLLGVKIVGKPNLIFQLRLCSLEKAWNHLFLCSVPLESILIENVSLLASHDAWWNHFPMTIFITRQDEQFSSNIFKCVKNIIESIVLHL